MKENKVSFRKPGIDNRTYKSYNLENGMEVLLIQDKEEKKAGAALIIPVGCFYDMVGTPEEKTEGKAHFCEHLLFMGTEKYPDEKEYHDFITKHNGKRNGFTSFPYTAYFFEVEKGSFEGAIDRFAQFFISPLFKKECVERELEIVNSEYELGLTSEFNKILEMLQLTVPDNHPIKNFAVGNLETLKKENIRDIVKKYYDTFYSSNLMKLVVITPEEFSKTEKTITDLFSLVPNKNIDLEKIEKENHIRDFPLKKEFIKNKIIKFEPTSDFGSLGLYFVMDGIPKKDYKTSQIKIISHLIGHEGKFSLFDYLKKKGLVTSLSSSPFFKWNGYYYFSVIMTLTKESEKDEEKIKEIIRSFYAYIKLMKESKESERKKFFEEVKKLDDISFQFKEKSQLSRYVIELAMNSIKMDLEDCIIGHNFTPDTFNNKVFEDELSNFNPDNMITMWSSKSFEGKLEKIGKWYKTKYDITGFDLNLNEENTTNPELKIPEENVFVPDDLKVIPLPKEKENYPKKIHSTEKLEVYFKQDDTFKRPKTTLNIYFKIIAPLISAKDEILNELFIDLIKDDINSELYPCLIAGYTFNLQSKKDGFSVRVEGYSQKVFKVCELILERIFGVFKAKEDRFKVLKEEIIRKYQNMDNVYPIQMASIKAINTMDEGKKFSYEEKREEAKEVTIDDINNYVNTAFEKIFAQMIVVGNHNEEEIKKKSLEIEKWIRIEKKVALSLKEKYSTRILKLKNVSIFEMMTKNEQDNNNALFYLLQIGLKKKEDDILLEMLQQLMSSDFFVELRAKKRIGYVVSSGSLPRHNTNSFCFYIQSSTHKPSVIEKEICSFILDFYERKIKEMDDKTFNELCIAVKNKYDDPFKNIKEECLYYGTEIINNNYKWNRKVEYSNTVGKITKQMLKDLYVNNFIEKKNVLQVWIYSKKFESEIGKDLNLNEKRQKIQDLDEFSKSTNIFPAIHKF